MESKSSWETFFSNMIQECCCQLLLKMFTVNYVQLSESRRSKQTSGSSSHACVVLRVCNNMPSTSLSRRHEQSASSADQGVQRPRGCDGAGGGAEAGDQYSQFMLRMTQRMERLGNEVNSFRDEMMTIFIMPMNTAREARELTWQLLLLKKLMYAAL